MASVLHASTLRPSKPMHLMPEEQFLHVSRIGVECCASRPVIERALPVPYLPYQVAM